jgi:hypothetical protein
VLVTLVHGLQPKSDHIDQIAACDLLIVEAQTLTRQGIFLQAQLEQSFGVIDTRFDLLRRLKFTVGVAKAIGHVPI